MDSTAQLPANVEKDLLRLKAYFPYRICFAANKGEEWVTEAHPTKRRAMKLNREGWAVWYIGGTNP